MFRKKIKKRTLASDSGNPEMSRNFSHRILQILIGVFLATCGYVLFFSPFLVVNQIIVTGHEELSLESIREFAENEMAGKWFKLLPRDTLLALPLAEISSGLTDNFKKIETVQLTRIFPDALAIRIKERSVVIVWCSDDKCSLVDRNGVAYLPVDFSSPEVQENESKLIVVRDESGTPIADGQNLVDAEYLDFIISIRQAIQERTGIGIRREFKTPRLISGDLRIESEDGWSIWVSRELGSLKTSNALGTVLEESIPSEKRMELEYVDLRTENRAYYKYKQSTENSSGEKSPEEKKDAADRE